MAGLVMKEIVSLSHPLVQHLVKLKKSKEYRYQEKSLLLEGKNCIFDVTKKHKAKRILITQEVHLPTECQAEEVIVVSKAIIEKISAVKSPDDIVAELCMPKESTLSFQKNIVALDGIQDPGNLGTIIRTALALGWEGIFFIEPCCDPFNDKALRAAKGATFDCAFQHGSWKDFSELVAKNGYTILVADLQGELPEAFIKEEKKALILGNEAHGVKPPNELAYKKVTLLMNKEVESLNVAIAGAILMYALKERCNS